MRPNYVPDAEYPGPHKTRGRECLYCEKPVLARQLCSMHYNRWRRFGDPLHERKVKVVAPTVHWGLEDLERDDDFWARVARFQQERLAA